MNTNKFLVKWYSLVLAVASFIIIAGCNDKEDRSLRIVDGDDNRISLYYPNTNEGCITIDGGVRPYSVTCESDILNVHIDKWPNAFNYEVLGVGEAKVKVSDTSGRSILLDVTIQYREWNFEIAGLDVCVEGERLTAEERKELEEKALSTIPVKEGGSYRLIYMEPESGIVHTYTDSFTTTRIEGTFTTSYVKVEEDEPIRKTLYTIRFGDEEHLFFPYPYNLGTRGDMQVMIAFYEDLLEKYQADYPEVEKVYTMQVMK